MVTAFSLSLKRGTEPQDPESGQGGDDLKREGQWGPRERVHEYSTHIPGKHKTDPR